LQALSLRANFQWTFAGNAVYAASQFGVLMVLARLGNAEMVGKYALGLAIAAPVMALAMLQLLAVQVTDARGEYRFEDYFGLRIVLTLGGLVVIAGCAALGPYETETAWVIFWVGLAKCVDSVNDIVRGLFQRHERMNLSGISLMIKGPASLAALGLLMWWRGSLVQGAAAMAVVWLIGFAAYDMPQARRLLGLKSAEERMEHRFRPRFDPRVMLRLTWVALPLGIVMFLINLQANIPRYVLQGSAGDAALGYFAAVVSPMVVGTMVTLALGQSASPRLARYFAYDLPAFRRLLGKLLRLGAVLAGGIVLGVVVLGRLGLRLVYGPEYAEYYPEFVVVSFGFAIQLVTTFWGFGLTAARSFRSQVGLAAISCLVATLAALVLIPRWGVMGGAVSVLSTSVVMLIAFALAMSWVVGRRAREWDASRAGDQPKQADSPATGP
jgi:O-antigen/teichoic acid export membrane protein